MFNILFQKLQTSPFRRKFILSDLEKNYVQQKGLDVIRLHAADFVAKRLAPDFIPNDGKQTPMKGHPVFKAQHATACCCRSCLYKWHRIPQGRNLTQDEQKYIVDIIMYWIEKQL